MRRISTGVLGGPILGVLSTTGNNVVTLTVDADLVFQPNGVGDIVAKSNIVIDNEKNLRLADNAGDNYVALKAPTTLASNLTLTMPSTNGTSGYVLQTNGSGTLSWAEVALTISNQTTSGSAHYPLMATATSGATGQTIYVSSTKLSFVPSTGTLACTAGSMTNITISGTASLGSSVDINGGAIDATPIGASSASTGSFSTLTATSITESSSIAYKENITPIEGALEKVLQLAGVIYDRKDGSRKGEAGLIAEDVAPIIPNVVSFKDGKPEGINYTKLSAYFVEAIKELAQRIK